MVNSPSKRASSLALKLRKLRFKTKLHRLIGSTLKLESQVRAFKRGGTTFLKALADLFFWGRGELTRGEVIL
jgi:hypothetical protein